MTNRFVEKCIVATLSCSDIVTFLMLVISYVFKYFLSWCVCVCVCVRLLAFGSILAMLGVLACCISPMA